MTQTLPPPDSKGQESSSSRAIRCTTGSLVPGHQSKPALPGPIRAFESVESCPFALLD